MTEYAKLNLLLLVIALVITRYCILNRRHLSLAIKVALIVPFLGFPWDFFGITLKAWGHTNPGPVFLGVPLNEMLLAFLMSYITAGILLRNLSTILDQASSKTKGEQRTDYRSQRDPNRVGGGKL